MKIIRFVFATALVFTVLLPAFSQLPATSTAESKEEKAKARLELEKKALTLVDRAAEEVTLLKLPENRAYVNAHVADLLWKRDEKRARRLFRSAAEELILAQTELEKIQYEMSQMSTQMSQPRHQILQIVARRDPDLALELLILTRPARLVEEMQKAAAAEAGLQAVAGQNEPAQVPGFESRYLVQTELRLEQSFTAFAARKDPERGLKLIRENLAKNGVTPEIWNTLQMLYVKYEEAAKSLLAEAVAKLLESDLWKKESERQSAAQFLMRFSTVKRTPPAPPRSGTETKERVSKMPFQPDDKMLRDVAGKMVETFLQAKNFTSLNEINRLLPTLQKLVPERVAPLRQKQAALKKTMTAEQTQQLDLSSAFNNQNATPEERIRTAAKAPPWMRQNSYREAISKMVQNGEADRARHLLTEAPPSIERDKALEWLDSLVAQKAVKEGKLDDARRIIGKLTNKSAQAEQLVQTARVFHAKNTKEDREIAAGLMDEATRLIYDAPQSEEETNALLSLVAGYAIIEPNRAFLLLDPLIEQVNEVTQASAVLSKYNRRDQSFRNGEMSYVFGLGRVQGSLARYRRELGLLAAADFERTQNLTDRFTRQEVQILARLTLSQSILLERNEIEGAGIGTSAVISTN
ncbi:MAG: hypothetical protein M3209_17730 [Acidobacteriota bacterium]|nr:hypothetical protein [Acidobacteriota bacterium]